MDWCLETIDHRHFRVACLVCFLHWPSQNWVKCTCCNICSIGSLQGLGQPSEFENRGVSVKDIKKIFQSFEKKLRSASWFDDQWAIYNRGPYLQLDKVNWFNNNQSGEALSKLRGKALSKLTYSPPNRYRLHLTGAVSANIVCLRKRSDSVSTQFLPDGYQIWRNQ